ncbi:MAG: hypothetical protein A2042_06670 [Candidatus Schekmanbacteria bacterium GWA2_38_11]|uniref:Uncharacterized protein n=1 Tax=Candidatus Schekmanbacteria bacterium GWA2_38_11 TaxID=1817876 RepID=A0A1F7RBX3_9BACT|nr:MAG: hypothetical protein A2042_06670 [Candidatus Schekmanbacteria bacterium GWA2_38_11]
MIFPTFSFLSILAVASWSFSKGKTESTTGFSFPVLKCGRTSRAKDRVRGYLMVKIISLFFRI